MLLVPFEDSGALALRPLVDTRPVYDLRLGIRSTLQTIQAAFPNATGTILHTRDYLAATARAEHGLPANRIPAGVDVLFVNGRWIAGAGDALGRVEQALRGSAKLFVQDDTVVAAWIPAMLDAADLPDFIDAEELTRLGGPSTEHVALSTAKLVESVPGVVHGVRDAIERDFAVLRRGYRQVERENVTMSPSAVLVDEDAIYLAEGVTVKANAVLSAENGPIYLDAGVTVHEGAVLRGPLYMGPMSHANTNAKLDGIAVGPGCKIGGEVHTTIVFGFSNKAHDGFMGHTYVGQWCNIGAGTDVSNLRNDYGPVSLYSMHERAMQSTGKQFMGLVLGDHSKCSIGTTFNTGTVVGVGGNLYGPGFHDRFVPAFTWGSPGAYTPYRVDKFLRVAEAVMPRRDRELTPEQEELLRYLSVQANTERPLD